MFYYVDYARCGCDDVVRWYQVCARMSLQDALEVLKRWTAKGWVTRLQVCSDDRHFTVEVI
jgi:hypothetical protein